MQDNEIEGIESLIFSFANSSNFLILGNNQIEISLLDDDSDSDNDGVLDAIDSCPTEVGPDANNGCPWLGFLINEVLYDPQVEMQEMQMEMELEMHMTMNSLNFIIQVLKLIWQVILFQMQMRYVILFHPENH